MTSTPLPEPAIQAHMYPGPRKLRPLVRLLRHVPRNAAETTLAAVAVVDGLVRSERFRKALRWAGAQGVAGRDRYRLAFEILANHGRFVAAEAMLGVETLSDLSRDVDVVGGDRLRAAEGALLLGFHLGPPRTWLTLRALGFPVRFAGRADYARDNPDWGAALSGADVVQLPDDSATGRLRSLYTMRRLIHDGALVYLTADGPFGREAFRIDLPGGALSVRSGWLALRRHTRAPTYPVLVRREGQRRVIEVHPPLPDVDADRARDTALCRDALSAIVRAYVRLYPAQCRYLALPRWNRPRSGAAVPEQLGLDPAHERIDAQ